VGPIVDGDRAPATVAAHLGVGAGRAPCHTALDFRPLRQRRRSDRGHPLCDRRPLARPLLLQFLALALAVDLAANAPFVPEIIVGYSPLLLLLIAYPEPRRLLTPFWRGSIDRSLLALALVTGAFFVPEVWLALESQVRGADDLALNYGWASIVEHLCNLWLIALLAAFRQPGATLLALMVAACLLYLGVAAIAVPDNPGSWGLAGGAIAIAGGAAYVAMTARAWRRGSPLATR